MDPTLPLEARIDAYLRDDPDPEDRETVRGWRAEGNITALDQAFGTTITFGTAGLRARVAPGPANMNARIVRRATRALLEALVDRVIDARERGIVVGYDARPSSDRFARDVRGLAGAAGFRVRAFRDPVPTPLVAFAAHAQNSAAAVVITASHNPPADNGMKVYGPDGALIVAPWDTDVSERMNDARPTPSADSNDAGAHWIGDDVADRYLARCLAVAASDAERVPIRVAYTALHGVGESYVRRALARLGGVDLESVSTQAEPDGTFPTVPKPNPEEPGALDRLLELAARSDARIALANDPDADRLAVAVAHDGEWIVLHGDELGVLLGEHVLRSCDPAGVFLVSSIVSSPWLSTIAHDRGARFETTLTGHKWIHARSAEVARDGMRFVFGYEEALGYAFDNGVRDKDGIAAAVVVTRLASELAAERRTLVDRLESIARTHGMHRSRSFSVALTADDRAFPTALAGRAVQHVIDGKRSVIRAVDGSERALGLPASSLVGAELEGGVRVLVRPSGTEPKTKVYLDYATTLDGRESYVGARRRCDAELERIEHAVRSHLTR